MLFSLWALLFLTLTKAEQHSPQPVFQNICPSVAALWGSEMPPELWPPAWASQNPCRDLGNWGAVRVPG